MGREATSTYSTKGWGVRFGGHPLCQLALGWPCAPVPLPSGLCSDGTAAVGGAAYPCINQKALLARVFSSTLSLFTLNALEDYLVLNGCVSGAAMDPPFVAVHPKSECWRFSKTYLENVASFLFFSFCCLHCMKTGITGSLNCIYFWFYNGSFFFLF